LIIGVLFDLVSELLLRFLMLWRALLKFILGVLEIYFVLELDRLQGLLLSKSLRARFLWL